MNNCLHCAIGIAIAILSYIPATLIAQDFYTPNQVNEIRLYFTQNNWDQILDNLVAAGQDGRLTGNAVINGVTYNSVGVRYKGNSSYNPNFAKNPFNIKLDYINQDQLMDGIYGTIKLSNGLNDPSFVRETLAYEIARKYMPASLANYANVYVNDVLIGVYTSVQDVDSYFMRTHLHCSDKPRFKCVPYPPGNPVIWGYLGADSTAYESLYEIESDYGWADLIAMTYTLNNDQNNIATKLNVDQHLWMIAYENLLDNFDSSINIFHNFYMFGDASNRLNPIIWDKNEAFGVYNYSEATNLTMTQLQQYDPLANLGSNIHTLISHVLSNPRYRKMYIAHMRTILAENFSNNWYATRGADLQSICAASVQVDSNFFFPYADFQANLNTTINADITIPGITTLMNARATYLLNCSAFSGTLPDISDINHIPENVVPNSMVQFTMTTANANFCQLGIRQDISQKFDYYVMYDDGNHGDGAVNDGVFGCSVPIGYGNIQYYGYAENASQGAFLPARAEHEFFEIILDVEPGVIVFNEIMAKNATFLDPYGDPNDWVELYNTSDSPVNIGGMYMTDSHYSNGVSAWTQIPANAPALTTIPAHGYLIVWYDEETAQGPLHINDKLGGAADAVYLIDSDGTTVVDTYAWTATAGLNTDDVSIGRVPDGGNDWILFGVGQTNPVTQGASNTGGAINAAPVITDVQYNPHATNASSVISVSAIVSDPDANLSQVLLLWGDGDYTQNTSVMNLQNSRYSAQIGPFTLNTLIHYRVKAIDAGGLITLSRILQFTIGYQAPTLYINEIMASNTMTIMDNAGEYEDWVEIYNPTTTAINLAGYYLIDNHYYDINPSILAIPSTQPNSTIVPPHGYGVFWFDEEPDQGVLHVNSKLGVTADGVYLLAPDMMTVIDSISWTAETALAEDLSYGRDSDGSVTWVLFGVEGSNPATPGTMNNTVGNNENENIVLPVCLAVYPNPVSTNLYVHLKNYNQPAKVSIYNIKGQLVNTLTLDNRGKQVWDMTDENGNNVKNGVYLISVKAGSKALVQKTCIMR